MKNKTLSVILIIIVVAVFLPALLEVETVDGYYTILGLSFMVFVPWSAIRLSKLKD